MPSPPGAAKLTESDKNRSVPVLHLRGHQQMLERLPENPETSVAKLGQTGVAKPGLSERPPPNPRRSLPVRPVKMMIEPDVHLRQQVLWVAVGLYHHLHIRRGVRISDDESDSAVHLLRSDYS